MTRLKESTRLLSAARGAVAVGVVVVVLAAAIGGASVARGDDSATVQADVASTTTDWPVNERGQTYGSEVNAKSEADAPDLIAVIGTNGKQGYCLNSQLNALPVVTKTAEQAEAVLRDVLCKGTVIPVFASDGVTQLGVFQIAGPGVEMTGGDAEGNTVTITGRADGTLLTKTQKDDGTVVTVSEKADGTCTTTTVKSDGATVTKTE